ncbi:M56 family metallopeptidase [Brumimicrobium mesophilum]|uniref:M56 family metallopeptidase n=1 Tax=Brumimicrobium mesophilum TaxID=392717 RepID=UPI000D141FCD|nr:M56 family metallopeptidase [Brumimicrobium mesophilum]
MEFLLFNVYFLVLAVIYRALFDKNGKILWNRRLLIMMPMFLLMVLYINNVLTSQSVGFLVEFDLINVTNSQQAALETYAEISVTNWLGIIYLSGVVTFSAIHIYNFIKLFQLIRRSNFLEKYRGSKVYVSDFNASFGNIIFIKENLTDAERKIILAHEFAHIRQMHSAERVFALIVQTICWFNPGIYLWKADIEKNHEYLADQEVLADISREDYTLFLLEQRLNLKYNQLRLPLSNMSNLKSRVMRMNRKTSSVLSYLILPVLSVGMMSSNFLPTAETELVTPIHEQLNQKGNDPVEDVDVMPEFKGGSEGLMKFISNEVKYPKVSMENNSQGKVFVEAVISKTGEVTKVKILRGVDEHIDAEAIRVFEAMPDWIPAVKDDTNVACIVRVPINFNLDKKE